MHKANTHAQNIHAHTDAYIHARIRMPDTHTYMRRHAQLRAVKGGLADWGGVGAG